MPSIKGCDSSFHYYAILDCNNLPDEIKSITNKLTYKTAVKRHILTAGQSNESDILAIFKTEILGILIVLYYKSLC